MADREPQQSRLYRNFAHLYERIFSRFLRHRIELTLRTLQIPAGSRILEIGVGTGLSLHAYPADCDVVGIDVSPSMLANALRKVSRNDWRHVELRLMDALDLEFEDEQFDYVTAFHVASVVPDHGRLMDEMARVCKPGGKIALINHFRSEKRWLAPLIDLLDPLTRRLGWRTTLRYHDFLWRAPVRVDRRFKTSPHSLYTIVTATKTSVAPAPAAEAGAPLEQYSFLPTSSR
jgi:phosphatidylethanolamine/phosphatidyl-N-methylethanolamine N-methyltransferase